MAAYLDQSVPVIRPLNYPPGVPGRGYLIHDLGARGQILVANLCGRVELLEIDCPFRAMDRLLESLPNRPLIASWTFTLRPHRRRWPWAGTWTAG